MNFYEVRFLIFDLSMFTFSSSVLNLRLKCFKVSINDSSTFSGQESNEMKFLLISSNIKNISVIFRILSIKVIEPLFNFSNSNDNLRHNFH